MKKTRYISNPIYSVLCASYVWLGTQAVYEGKTLLGVGMCLVFVYTVFISVKESNAVYWNELNGFIDRMSKIKDPQLRERVGFPSFVVKPFVLDKTTLENKERGGINLQVQNVPADVVSMDKLKVFSQGVLDGMGFGERTWTGRDKLLTPKQYDSLMESLEAKKMLVSKSGKSVKQGRELTPLGRLLFQQMANQTPTLSLPKPQETEE